MCNINQLNIMMRIFLTLVICLFIPSFISGQNQLEFSTAGFYEIENSGRQVYSMNPGWQFYKGAVERGELPVLDDSSWDVVSLPNGIEYLPLEASGGVNYQGEVWYRKHFTPEKDLKGKKLFLHFEAIMGKSKIYVNGKLLKENFGGYLPAVVDMTDAINWEGDNIIAVWADNSNDPSYPPGKFQDVLDFTYFGGIYRDCWLISHDSVYITDPNYEKEVASGGLFVAYDNVSEKSADIILTLQLRNELNTNFSGKVEYLLQTAENKTVARLQKNIRINANEVNTIKDQMKLIDPLLWSPESPTRYHLQVRIKDKKDNAIDGFEQKIGVRSLEFKGEDGFWLNGKPYPQPIIGANRHQDYAIVGNAVSNSAHWRDAKKLRDAGIKVIRNAHYPQDPAFMDACDELGLLVIVNTPGWQFWEKNEVFEQRIYNDIRQMVRRDRNRPCIWMWEPVLNETNYPDYFGKEAQAVVKEEYPYPYCYCVSDNYAKGSEFYPVQYAHPMGSDDDWVKKGVNKSITLFTREWGDNVDDWSAQNSPSRIARNWGEAAMLVQAQHYADPPYDNTSYNSLSKMSRQHIGGALWHSFDHQRGYHPDPFYGGLMDAFRQPKYSYYMFKAQRDPYQTLAVAESGPMVFIAHEMTPFSGKDVVVYSNCDEVRLTYNKDGEVFTYKKDKQKEGLFSPIITFKDVYDFMIDRNRNKYNRKGNDIYLLAEGYLDGKLVATHKVTPSRRPSKLLLWVDNDSTDLVADGSDFVTVIAAVADRNNTIKRLSNYTIKFHIEGEGSLIGDQNIMANPSPVRWGTAPILVRSTVNPGKIKVTASVLLEGTHIPVEAELVIQSKSSKYPLIFDEKELSQISKNVQSIYEKSKPEKPKGDIDERLKEVEKAQEDFGEKK